MRTLFVTLLAVRLTSAAGFGAVLSAPVDRFLERHCFDCHEGAANEGGLDLQSLSRDLSNAETLRRWVRVYDRVDTGEMPPKDVERPDTDVRKQFLASLEGLLTTADREQREVVYRRLNRSEYENTLRDLFLVRAEVATMLPEDGRAYGFDNIGEALGASTELVEAYLRAADVVIDMVLQPDENPPRRIFHSTFHAAFKNRTNAKQLFRFLDEGLVAYHSTLKSTQIRDYAAPVSGTYRVSFRARAWNSSVPVKMEIGAGDVHKATRGRHTVGYFEAQPEMTQIVFEDWFREGDGFSVRPFGIGSIRIGKQRKYAGPGLLLVDYDVEGPLDADLRAGRHELLGGVDLASATLADAEAILGRLLPRAFRRSVTDEEIDRYVGLMKSVLDEGENFETALRVGLRAVLCSANFLFLSEPVIDDSGRIDDFALASRLSYFLWSTMPDAELLELASRGELSRPDVRDAQVERMLKSPKAAAFTKNFTGQWLRLREIDLNEPDQVLYPEFDALLEHSMVEETTGFFNQVLRHNLSVMQFVDSDWSILNDRLATHYQVPGVTGVDFRSVALPQDSVRGGLLTQASILKVTANGTTTSPVLRGAWAIENLLGIHVPPPPPVPAIEPDLTGATTLRQQLDKHRNDVTCASCHSKIDPAGFAMENFDPIGGWREFYRIPDGDPVVFEDPDEEVQLAPYKLGLPVDATGILPSGETFRDIRELKALLVQDPDQITRCLAEKLLTYGLGRGLGFSDRATIERIVERTRDQQYGFRSLIHEVIASDAFLRP